jgi:hypothetical protein
MHFVSHRKQLCASPRPSCNFVPLLERDIIAGQSFRDSGEEKYGPPACSTSKFGLSKISGIVVEGLESSASQVSRSAIS